MNVDYMQDYRCTQCQKTGVKLWRKHPSGTQLFCAPCASIDQHEDITGMDADGMHPTRDISRTDQIGWCIPAVPYEDGSSYWNYRSVPGAGVQWWKRLPTF